MTLLIGEVDAKPIHWRIEVFLCIVKKNKSNYTSLLILKTRGLREFIQLKKLNLMGLRNCCERLMKIEEHL